MLHMVPRADLAVHGCSLILLLGSVKLPFTAANPKRAPVLGHSVNKSPHSPNVLAGLGNEVSLACPYRRTRQAYLLPGSRVSQDTYEDDAKYCVAIASDVHRERTRSYVYGGCEGNHPR